MVPPLRPLLPSLAIAAASLDQTYVPPKPDPVEQLKDQQQDPIAQDDSFGPALIVMSPTATMTQADHVFSFPPGLRPQGNNVSSNTAIHYISASATASTNFMSLSFKSNEEPAAGARSSAESHSDDKSHATAAHGHPSRANNGSSEQEHGKLGADSQDRGRSLTVETEAPTTTYNTGSRRGSSQHSRPIQVKETLNACVTQTADGHTQLGDYVIKKTLGQGAYGIVNLGYNVKDETYYVRGMCVGFPSICVAMLSYPLCSHT